MKSILLLVTACLSCLTLSAVSAEPDEKISVTESDYNGFKCLELTVGEMKGFVIQPTFPAADGSKPWLWYAPGSAKNPRGSAKWTCLQLLKEGYAICGTDVGDTFGSPQSRITYSKFYHHVTKEYGLSPKVCLFPQSRGGLMWYNWAVENPEKIACIGGVYPVCDFTSYPGVAPTAKAYGMTKEELTAKILEHNPIERLAPLAKAKVPIMHLHGDDDKVVPLEKNSGELIKRYQALGGPAELVIIPGKGHAEIPEFFQSEKLVAFFLAHGKAAAALKK